MFDYSLKSLTQKLKSPPKPQKLKQRKKNSKAAILMITGYDSEKLQISKFKRCLIQTLGETGYIHCPPSGVVWTACNSASNDVTTHVHIANQRNSPEP